VLPPTSMRFSVTDGVVASSDHISRALGIDDSICWSKLVWMRVAEVSMTGDAPLTVTVSCSAATFRLTLTCALKPSVMRMPSRTLFWKPASSNASRYSPGGTAGKR
jgi:hypothetical protein